MSLKNLPFSLVSSCLLANRVGGCHRSATVLLLSVWVLALSDCGEMATLPVSAGTGPQPTLPQPRKTLLPTVNIAPATGWAADTTPLAAETNAQPKPDDANKGIRG